MQESNETKGWRVFSHPPMVLARATTVCTVFQMDNRQLSVSCSTPGYTEEMNPRTALLSRSDLRCYEATHAPRQCHAGPEDGDPAAIPNTDAFFSEWDRDVTHLVFNVGQGTTVRADKEVMRRAFLWLHGDLAINASEILDMPTVSETGGA
jgi:hypothetical protein